MFIQSDPPRYFRPLGVPCVRCGVEQQAVDNCRRYSSKPGVARKNIGDKAVFQGCAENMILACLCSLAALRALA
ncbi:hypothetical protein RLO149_c004040 [Roseobacter litoralis Och 149]|uniref:Uncharacterized protein n=1 Tax=Roseobacter litoralis (strain ATCC 49566 / DSM 6996 / JCM 21268 / NBRC 15278 / OCh 149) TaxID=391595 RepID=F7ZHM3_ROSLO|nr:hypothetical protein RLO149_c004040 [Roseobacter litoralis Och 149]